MSPRLYSITSSRAMKYSRACCPGSAHAKEIPTMPELSRTVLNLFAAAALAVSGPPAAAQTVLYDQSRITCVSRQMNVPVEARFKKFSAQIAFDPAKPTAGSARIEIELESFDIDNAEVNDEARGKQWFDARNFPKATFVTADM